MRRANMISKLKVLAAITLLIVGCSSTTETNQSADQSPPETPDQQQAQADLPGDSAAAASPPAPSLPVEEDGLTTEYIEYKTATAAAPPTSQSTILDVLETVSPGEGIAIDAMVGQVNGRPIYANEVFEPMDDQLAIRGRQVSRQKFYSEAKGDISKRLESMIIQALILGEAERNLSPQEQFGLGEYLKQQKDKLIRVLGKGSAILADTTVRQDSGISLDEKVEEIRTETLVKKYTQEKIIPQINVSRKDIKRYYKNHYEEFNPPPGRTIHLIRASDIQTAVKIDKLLADGKPFLEIASDGKLNINQAAKQGFFLNTQSDSFFGKPEIDEQVLALKQGEHTPRVKLGSKYCWVYVKTLSTGESKPLRQVQAKIENRLRTMQYQRLTARFYSNLLTKGSYDSPQGMVDLLMEVAMNRYAQPR